MEFRAFGMTPEFPTGPSSTATISHVNVNPEFYDKPVTGTAGVSNAGSISLTATAGSSFSKKKGIPSEISSEKT